MAGSRANFLAKESEGELDRKASQCGQEDLFWKEVGRKRGYSILAGRMFVNVKLARWRKAQRSTGSTTALNGTKSDEILEAFRKLEQKAKTLKNEWEVVQRYCCASCQ